MADYTSIDDIVAGVENATQLRTNSKQDDGTDTITGVDWFSYNGTVCNSIYVNGNSWIGLGANSEHFKFNRRDSAMWNLWREEGTYLGYYKFLRIRWNGYCTYDLKFSHYLQTFDLILFDTGDIMLYAVDIPTGHYDGTFSLGDLTYTAPTTESRFVTFYLQSDGTYTIDYAPIILELPYTRKYLIKANNTIYTVVNDVLTAISGNLNAQLFIDNGVDEIPSGTLLMTLSNPEVLCWTNAETLPTLTATVKGIPEPQIVMSKEIDLMHSSIKGINGVTVDCKGDVLFAVSFDKKATWMMHNGTEWVAVSDKLAGMTKTEFEAITTDQWQPKYEASSEMYIRCAILDETQSITTVNIDFIN